MSLYVDGQLVGTNSTTQSTNYVGYWRLGGEDLSLWPYQPTSDYFAGTVSDAAFYNVELSAGQVQAHYLASPLG